MRPKNSKLILHKILIFTSLVIILFSTDIANKIAYDSNVKVTDMDCIRYQISIIIPCLIISINSCVHLYMHTKANFRH